MRSAYLNWSNTRMALLACAGTHTSRVIRSMRKHVQNELKGGNVVEKKSNDNFFFYTFT